MLVQGDERRTLGRGIRRGLPRGASARARRPRRRRPVAFLDRNGIAYFDFLFGGSLIGAVNVAVNWRLAPAEMAAIIDDSGAPLLAIHADYLPALARHGERPALGPSDRGHRRRRGGLRGSAGRVASTTWIDGCPPKTRVTWAGPTK